ncbi:MAG: hypothetical protein L0H94_02050 [Nitrospira sp.]|nr:hypothetical protein [Nitrospira sp.]
MLPAHNRPIAHLAEEEGISAATLYPWRAQARAQGRLLPNGATEPAGWRARGKFAAVVETAGLSEAERAEYCRKGGLYPDQLNAWLTACEQATEGDEARAGRHMRTSCALRTWSARWLARRRRWPGFL